MTCAVYFVVALDPEILPIASSIVGFQFDTEEHVSVH